MKKIPIVLLVVIFIGCSNDPYEQKFIDLFSKKEVYAGFDKTGSIISMAGELEQFLLDHQYISKVDQDEYYRLINQLLSNESVIDQKLLEKDIPNSWLFAFPPNQACILKCGNRIVDENPDMPADHPVRILTENFSKLAKFNDLSHPIVLKDVIYKLPPEEFKKIHYHLHPLALIQRLIEEKSR